MDNASKALIIAGAVLIAVMLVSVGVMIYQQAAGVIGQGQSNMDALEVQMANQMYSQYFGAKKNRNTAAQLLDTAAQQKAAGAEHTVDVVYGTTTLTTETEMRAKASEIRAASNTTYTIASSATDGSGYITQITITPVS